MSLRRVHDPISMGPGWYLGHIQSGCQSVKVSATSKSRVTTAGQTAPQTTLVYDLKALLPSAVDGTGPLRKFGLFVLQISHEHAATGKSPIARRPFQRGRVDHC